MTAGLSFLGLIVLGLLLMIICVIVYAMRQKLIQHNTTATTGTAEMTQHRTTGTAEMTQRHQSHNTAPKEVIEDFVDADAKCDHCVLPQLFVACIKKISNKAKLLHKSTHQNPEDYEDFLNYVDKVVLVAQTSIELFNEPRMTELDGDSDDDDENAELREQVNSLKDLLKQKEFRYFTTVQ